jgi:hypothetical protein
LFPAGHKLPAEFGPEPTEGSHKATRHAARGRQDQFLMMRYNTGLTAAPASPLYGSPVCKRSPIQVLSTDCAQCCLTTVIEGTEAFNIAYGRWPLKTLKIP